MNLSLHFVDCDKKSLCGTCELENVISSPGWSCGYKGRNAFLNKCIFYEGKCLCKTGRNPDCIYKYGNNCIVAIEIKDQRENNIKYDQLVEKIKNYYEEAIKVKLNPTIFILQVSSEKNKEYGIYELKKSCEYGLQMYGLSVGKNEKLFSIDPKLSHINCRFIVVKCSYFTEEFFLNLINESPVC